MEARIPAAGAVSAGDVRSVGLGVAPLLPPGPPSLVAQVIFKRM
jgi:hypothetical protein